MKIHLGNLCSNANETSAKEFIVVEMNRMKVLEMIANFSFVIPFYFVVAIRCGSFQMNAICLYTQ